MFKRKITFSVFSESFREFFFLVKRIYPDSQFEIWLVKRIMLLIVLLSDSYNISAIKKSMKLQLNRMAQ